MARIRTLLPVLLALLALLALPAAASAGQWVQVSCQNPDGSAASNQGWSVLAGSSDVNPNCGPGQPLDEVMPAPAPASSGGTLNYTPPAGSSIAGGSLDVSGYAGGHGDGGWAAAVVYYPAEVWTADAVYLCYEGDSQNPCSQTGWSFATTVNLPANQGGDLNLQLACTGGGPCDQGGANGVAGRLDVSAARLLLSNSSVPAGSGFSGTTLDPGITGTTHLLFTATDPDGPGVYNVTAAIDGNQVYSATPDTNNGACVSHGTYPATSALEFDYAQPCPQTEAVTVPVNASSLANGHHELTVTVTDAAGNSATVLDQTISVENPVATQTTPQSTTIPAPSGKKKQIHVRIGLSWTWRRNNTRLHAIRFADRIPAHSSVAVTCKGQRCPHNLGTTSKKLTLKSLIKRLKRDTFHPGQRLYITIAHPGYIAQRAEVSFRKGLKPKTKLL